MKYILQEALHQPAKVVMVLPASRMVTKVGQVIISLEQFANSGGS